MSNTDKQISLPEITEKFVDWTKQFDFSFMGLNSTLESKDE